MNSIHQAWRRSTWLFDNFLTARKLWNYALLAWGYFGKRKDISAWPAVLKIDISPMCNLKCPVCVHADTGTFPELSSQSFKKKYMSREQFKAIVDEARGKVSAFSLYYLGDPFMHPDIDEFCRMSREAGINVHLSSNFSFNFSDERILRIASSGLTHLTVCVDGFSQETYGQTRKGGRLSFVLSNLERLCQYRRERGLIFPKIEVQFIRFNHNVHEFDAAMKYFRELGVDTVESYWGMVNNYTDLDPSRFEVEKPLPKSTKPRCYWPFATMTIKWNGDVIPCCNFRHGSQYVEGADSRALGNVFKDGVRGVWDNQQYRQARGLCSKPDMVNSDAELKKHFCYGCPALYESSYSSNVKLAPDYDVNGHRAVHQQTQVAS